MTDSTEIAQPKRAWLDGKQPDPEFYDEHALDVIGQFRALKARKGWGNKTVGLQIGMSHPAVSALLNAHYNTSTVPALVGQLEDILEREQLRAAQPPAPEYVPTSVSEAVYAACYGAHIESNITLVIGPTGVGKTMGFREYERQHPDTIYLVAGTGATQSTLVSHLAGRIGADPQGSSFYVRQRCEDELRDSDRLLIADEMDYARTDCLQMLRLIHDAASLGLVIAGTNELLERLRRCGKPTIRQFTGRVGFIERPPATSDEDLRMLAAQHDLPEGALDILVPRCAGQARRLHKAIAAAARLAGQNGTGGHITLEHLHQAFEQLPPPDF